MNPCKYLLGLCSALCLVSTSVAKPRIVATTPDLGAIARAVGGDRIDVESIVAGYQDPHFIEAKPSYMRRLNRADLLLYIGLELEVGWLPALIQGARNPRIAVDPNGQLDASNGIRVLGIPQEEVDRSAGDVHPLGNPHYMLDPRNGLIVAAALTRRLKAIDPDGAAAYEDGLQRFTQDMEGRLAAWEKRMAAWRGLRLVVYHQQWEYLAAWLGWEIVAAIEDKPGIPPSPRHIAAVVRQINAEQIRLIIGTRFADSKPAQRITSQTTARWLSLPISVGAEPTIDTYPDLFEALISRLENALRDHTPNAGSDG